MGKVYKFTGKKVPEQQRDYAPILRDRVMVEIQPKQYGFFARAMLWACFLSVYGFLFVSIYQGL